MPEYIALGKFTKTHGIKGELLFVPYNPSSSEITGYESPLFIHGISGYQKLNIENIRKTDKGFLIKIAGVNLIDDAINYRNKQVLIRKTDITLEKDEYLISDLVNLECVNQDNKNIGVVSEIYNGNINVMEVKSLHGIFLIPMTGENIITIDLEKKVAIVKNEGKYKI